MAPERLSPPVQSETNSSAALRLAFELASDTLCCVEADTWRIVELNRAAESFFGVPRSELLGRSLTQLLPTFDWTASLQSIDTERSYQVVVRHASGTQFLARCRVARCEQPGQAWLVIALQAEDAAANTIDRRATVARDEVTGLPTRSVLERRLSEAIEQARSSDYHFAVFFIDIDMFKQANDTWGHLVGDEILRTLAARLSHGLRPSDLVTRYGGDEFVALLDDVRDASQAQQIADRMRQMLRVPMTINGQAITVTASIGIALSRSHPIDAETLLHAADQAMYKAKQQGRTGNIVIAEGA